jgi:hypothetical protein
MGHGQGMMDGKRTPGRKPVDYIKLDCKNKEDLKYLIKVIDKI